MSYSRGFGTKSNNSARTKKMSKGEKVKYLAAYADKEGDEVIRRRITDPAALAAVKEYLRGLPTSKIITETSYLDEKVASVNVLQKTHLRERETVTFDGSFTGGVFGKFHNEVVEVIKVHLGRDAYNNIKYISILADGLGAINLASIVKFMAYSGVHNTAEASFKSVPIDRIDYVESSKDITKTYNFSNNPPSSIYEDYLVEKTEGIKYIEFNYITEVNSTHGSLFFGTLGQGAMYSDNNKNASTKGDKKFSLNAKTKLPMSAEFENAQIAISLHVVPKTTDGSTNTKVGYAFAAPREGQSVLEGATPLPRIYDTNPSQIPFNDYVPDHAAIVTGRPSVGMVHKYKADKDKINTQLNTFYTNILSQIESSQDRAAFCKSSNAAGLCKSAGNINVTALGQKLKAHLENLREFYHLKVLIEQEEQIAPIIKDKKQLETALKDITKMHSLASDDNTDSEYFNNTVFPDLAFKTMTGDGKKHNMKTAAKRLMIAPYNRILPTTPERRKFYVTQKTYDTTEDLKAYANIMYHLAKDHYSYQKTFRIVQPNNDLTEYTINKKLYDDKSKELQTIENNVGVGN